MILIILFIILLVVLFIQTNGSLEPSLLDSVNRILSFFSQDLSEIEKDIEDEVKSIEDELIPKAVEKEVFHIPNQMFSYEEAKLFCKAIGVRLATLNEVKKSYLEGA